MRSHFYEVVDAFGKVWENSKKIMETAIFLLVFHIISRSLIIPLVIYATIRR